MTLAPLPPNYRTSSSRFYPAVTAPTIWVASNCTSVTKPCSTSLAHASAGRGNWRPADRDGYAGQLKAHHRQRRDRGIERRGSNHRQRRRGGYQRNQWRSDIQNRPSTGERHECGCSFAQAMRSFRGNTMDGNGSAGDGAQRRNRNGLCQQSDQHRAHRCQRSGISALKTGGEQQLKPTGPAMSRWEIGRSGLEPTWSVLRSAMAATALAGKRSTTEAWPWHGRNHRFWQWQRQRSIWCRRCALRQPGLLELL